MKSESRMQRRGIGYSEESEPGGSKIPARYEHWRFRTPFRYSEMQEEHFRSSSSREYVHDLSQQLSVDMHSFVQ
jgi:hypothetical protein